MKCGNGPIPYIRSRKSSDRSRIDKHRRVLQLCLSWAVEGSLYREGNSVGEDGESLAWSQISPWRFQMGSSQPMHPSSIGSNEIFQLSLSYPEHFNAVPEGSNAKENRATEVKERRVIDTKTSLGWTLLRRARCMSTVVDIAELYHPTCLRA